MNKAWIVLIILIGGFIVACQAESIPTNTPAPAPTIGRPPFGAAPVAAISLLRAPADFVDLDIELSGQYKPLPLLVCAEDTHTSPATWALVDGEIEILAAGFDEPLRELADTGLDLVVEGRWQRWEGPVGCGRRVPAEKIWYLAVSNIVSPNPLMAGGGGDDTIAQLPAGSPSDSLPEGSGDELLSPTPAQELPSDPGEAGEPTIPAQPTIPEEAAGRGTLTAEVTPTPAGTRTVPPTATNQVLGTATATSPAGGTSTPTRTPTPGSQATATPTPSMTAGATSSPAATSANTATATTIAGNFIPVGYEDLNKRTISANDSHTYQFAATAGDIVNIVAAPEDGLDVSIELVGPDGNQILTQGQNSAGQVESLGPIALSQAGIHKVIIRSVNSSGYYAVVVQETDSLPYVVFKGNLAYGDEVSSSVPIDQDDWWNFMGSAGDVITIHAVATTATDLVLYLNDPDAIELDFADDDLTFGPPNDEEVILMLQLSDDGMFTIGVGEIDFETIAYTLTLNRN